MAEQPLEAQRSTEADRRAASDPRRDVTNAPHGRRAPSGTDRGALGRLRGLKGVSRAAAVTDRIEGDRNEREDNGETYEGGYTPPQSPEQDHPLALGIKVALAMWIADAVARSCGFDQPTWTVLTAAFLATSPPLASASAAQQKVVAMFVGIVLGAIGAYSASLMSGVPSIHFALVGLVAGFMGSRSPEYLFAAVVGTVVTFVGTGGGDPLHEVVTTTICMILIGCVVGPLVVLGVEKVRAVMHERRA